MIVSVDHVQPWEIMTEKEHGALGPSGCIKLSPLPWAAEAKEVLQQIRETLPTAKNSAIFFKWHDNWGVDWTQLDDMTTSLGIRPPPSMAGLTHETLFIWIQLKEQLRRPKRRRSLGSEGDGERETGDAEEDEVSDASRSASPPSSSSSEDEDRGADDGRYV